MLTEEQVARWVAQFDDANASSRVQDRINRATILRTVLEDRAALLGVEKAAREVEKSLNSDVIFEEMREVWGNTNTYIWRRAIKDNGAALAALDRVRDGEAL